MEKKVKVHQFAKKNSCESKDVLKALHEMGYEKINSANNHIPTDLFDELEKKIRPFPIKEISITSLWNQTDITLDISNGLISIINGPNGVGKTTFMNLIKEIFHNQNFLEETAPLRKTHFKEIRISFVSQGVLKVSKSPQNEVVFTYGRKRKQITPMDITYEAPNKISSYFSRILGKECGFSEKLKRFVTEDDEEIILTDATKYSASQISLQEIDLEPGHTKNIIYKSRRYPRWSHTGSVDGSIFWEGLSSAIKNRWNNLDPRLLRMLSSINVCDIPTRRERAVNILDYLDSKTLQKTPETVDGISLKLRDKLNLINQEFLKKKNQDNANLGSEFFKTATTYKLTPDLKSTSSKVMETMLDKTLIEKSLNIRLELEEISISGEGVGKDKKDFLKLLLEFYKIQVDIAKCTLSPFLIPEIRKYGPIVVESAKAKQKLKEKGFFYHPFENFEGDEIAKLTETPDESFWGLSFLTPYLKTISQSKSSHIEEMQVFAKKTENFLFMVNKQYGLLNKEILLKKDHSDEHLIEARSTIDKKPIPLNVLSSGEKHVIILCYLLAFVGRDQIILIDEPEISMHVEWKDNFVDNLKRCLSETRSHAIIATHSPTLARAAEPDEISFFEPSQKI